MTYYVATLSSYVLVEAVDPAEAKEKGHQALHDLFADIREDAGKAPITIRTVRPATDDEIELMCWHAEMDAKESAQPH